MLPFYELPRMMVVYLIIKVCFYVNVFVWTKGASQIIMPPNIVEGRVLDYNLYFRVIFGEFIHTHEGTTNDIT